MTRRLIFRLRDVQQGIHRVNALLDGVTLQQLSADPDRKAALERYLEVISEASRHIPDALRQEYGRDLPWRNIADLGNLLRHTYHKSDIRTLWDIYQNDLEPLALAITAMLTATDQSG